MSLIEYLERDNWREVLRRSFEGAINLLQTDRFGRCSSAVDDIKSWLTCGGVSRVQLQLDRQMKGRRLDEAGASKGDSRLFRTTGTKKTNALYWN